MTTISENNLVTLINVFTVEPENQQRLVEILVEATEKFMAHQPGFISANLHKSSDGKRVANYAQWASVEEYQAMLQNPESRPHMEQAMQLATIDAHLYEVSHTHSIASQPLSPVPPDDCSRNLTLARPNEDQTLPHIGVVGDTYTVLLSGENTNGHYCLIDMLVAPGGGPAPHRHDFEETFIVMEGQIEATFRGQKLTVQAGQTLHIPSNAPHEFHNKSEQNVRLLCICGPSGQEEFFAQVGVALPTRTTSAPKLDDAAQAAFIAKAKELAPKYHTELLPPSVES